MIKKDFSVTESDRYIKLENVNCPNQLTQNNGLNWLKSSSNFLINFYKSHLFNAHTEINT